MQATSLNNTNDILFLLYSREGMPHNFFLFVISRDSISVSKVSHYLH